MATILRLLVLGYAQLLVIIYPGVLVFWLIFHTNIDYWRKVGKKAYAIAAMGWPLTAGPLLYFRDVIFSVRWKMPAVVVVLGLAALVIALLIASQAARSISRATLLGLPELEPAQSEPLLNTGIYSRTRNPIYLAHWLLIFSSAAITGFAANWAFFILDSILLRLMIRAEERELVGRYGSEYASYLRRVPPFFPRWT